MKKKNIYMQKRNNCTSIFTSYNNKKLLHLILVSITLTSVCINRMVIQIFCSFPEYKKEMKSEKNPYILDIIRKSRFKFA